MAKYENYSNRAFRFFDERMWRFDNAYSLIPFKEIEDYSIFGKDAYPEISNDRMFNAKFWQNYISIAKLGKLSSYISFIAD